MENCFPTSAWGPQGLERKAAAEGKLTRDSHFLPLCLKTGMRVCVNGCGISAAVLNPVCA